MQGTNKDREYRVNGSNANNKMCFEVRAPSSTSPPSPRRISNPLGVPNSSLNQYNLHRGNTKGLPKRVTNQTPPLTRGSKPTNSTSTKEGANQSPDQPLPKRDTTKARVFTTWRLQQPQTISFLQNKDPNRLG